MKGCKKSLKIDPSIHSTTFHFVEHSGRTGGGHLLLRYPSTSSGRADGGHLLLRIKLRRAEKKNKNYDWKKYMDNIFRFAPIFYKLTRTRFYIASQELFDKVINLYIWVFCSLVVMGYVMQAFGLVASYGCFQLATIMGTVGLFEIYGNAFRCMIDFEGDRH